MKLRFPRKHGRFSLKQGQKLQSLKSLNIYAQNAEKGLGHIKNFSRRFCMPKITARKMWAAEVELEISRLALSVQYIEKGSGSRAKRVLVPTDWLNEKGEIVFDIGKRLKGWLKEQVMTMKPTWRDKVQYGIVCKSQPNPGYVPIATLKDIEPSRNWGSFQHKDEYDLNGLPEPNVETILTRDGRSVFSFHYVLNKPITCKATIYCFAGGITPESVEEWLKTLGKFKGLGDLHNTSAGYGTFEVKSFKLLEEKEITF
jgi:hypothetical protein